MTLSLLVCTSAISQVNVTTYHNDNARTGQNVAETILTPANVNSSQFGKLFTVAVDGAVYAQPLVLSNVTIAGAPRRVLYVATEHDSVYAIDADTGVVYWSKSLLPAGGSTIDYVTDLNCGDITKEVGITGTPVIDSASGTLYVVAKVKVAGQISQYLHALDVVTAAEKFGGPAVIQASVPGKAADGNGSVVTFNPRMQNQRAALLLENGHVVIAWGAHCDKSPWHGWIMSYGAATLSLEGVFNPSANSYGNGIWMSGDGPVADAAGNIYLATGNGPWTGVDLGNSIIKLGPPNGTTFPVIDYFTPHDQAALTQNDTDLAAGGLVLLPLLPDGTQLLTMIGKLGTLYVVNGNNLGKYCVNQQPACTNSDPNIVQEIPAVFTHFWGSPSYWNGNVYWVGGNGDDNIAEPMKAFSFDANNSGLLSTSPTSVSAKSFAFTGPMPSVSSNGTNNGILWGLDNGSFDMTCVGGTQCQVLYAYDATNLQNLLYTSSQAAGNRDVPGSAVKFTVPTVANGKVYVGSFASVSAFGPLSAAPQPAAAPSFSPPAGTYSSAQSVTLNDTTPGATIYYTVDGSTPNTGSAIYSGAITVSRTAIVNAIATAVGLTSSGITNALYTITSAGAPPPVPVSFSTLANVSGIANDGSAVHGGGMDTYGGAYSEQLLGSTVIWSGLTFTLGSPGVADGVANATIPLPSGNYSTLNLLATGVHANQPNQPFVVTYSDGTTTTITQSLSDWHTPQNYAGESIAVTMAYRVSASGAPQAGPFYLYGYSFAINAAKTVKSIKLPNNRDVVVLAATLSGAAAPPPPPPPPPPPVPTPLTLSSVANVYALFNVGSPVTNGGLDGSDDAYSKLLLGASITWSGTTFPLGAAAAADAVSGTTIPLPAGQYSTLQLLGTGSHANQPNQTFTIKYTDGSVKAISQSLSDWFSPQSYPGEAIAATMAYRLIPTGATDNRPFNLYGYTFALDNTKTVQSITLPANRHVVVLAGELIP
jgi:Chitobiase/beta-hexosaminidase C-terminal domain